MKPPNAVFSRTSPLTSLITLAVALCTCLVTAGCEGSAPPADSSVTTLHEDVTGSSFEVVSFTTEDGLTLSGRLYGGGARAMLLSHMYPADQTSWDSEASLLAEQGYMALTFDFRGYGASEGEKEIQYLDRDIKAAVQYLRQAGADEVVLVGASMGGTASLVAAAQLQSLSSIRIAGVATFSAPVEFEGLDASDSVPALEIPMLFVAAENDVGADGARQLQTLSGDRGDLQILPGSDHGTELFLGEQAETAWRLLLDFAQLSMPAGG